MPRGAVRAGEQTLQGQLILCQGGVSAQRQLTTAAQRARQRAFRFHAGAGIRVVESGQQRGQLWPTGANLDAQRALARAYVAAEASLVVALDFLRLPLAAGLEPLNPNIATAPAEATPSAPPSLAPSYVPFLDDEVRYFWNELPAGTYQVHFRLRAAVAGTFTSPPGEAETMYRNDVYGASAGQQLIVTR